LTSSYQTTDGLNHTAADVWFVVQPLQSSSANANKLAQAIGQFESASGNTWQAASAKGLSTQIKTDGQLMPTALLVETMRVFEANEVALRVGSFDVNKSNELAGAASLAIGVSNDEKVKSKNSIDVTGSGLFLNSRI
jgi:hypothetical protein